jgi:hypothetical protein
VAFIGTVNFFLYFIMRDFRNVRMAVSARDIPVDGIGINIFVNVIALFSSFFVDPTDLTVLVSH